jgi:hypothetical protein
MYTKEARELGSTISDLVQKGEIGQAQDLLSPLLASKVSFALLDRIGEAIGAGNLADVNEFLDQVAAGKSMGGWVIIASALSQQTTRDPHGAFDRCRSYVILADIWYATDIMGERVPGPALVRDFELALSLLAPWRYDSNRWVRRAVGVSAHFWAKRAHGDPAKALQAESLLEFLEPMFDERNLDAVKGVGWGLKTLGKYDPGLLSEWLARQVEGHRPRALMLRKALTYLSPEERSRIRSYRCT